VVATCLEAIGRLDLLLFQWLRTFHSPYLDVLMAGVSDIARGGALWIGLALLVAAVHRARWPAAVQVLLVIATTWLATDMVAKPLFNRARPFEFDAKTRVYGFKPVTRSLPSGHAATAIAGAYALTRLAPEAGLIFWLLAGLVAFSRVYLGVHYPADVLAGVVLGWAVALFVIGKTKWRFAQAEKLLI
jgi:undecaprenyl-diphosphatase